MLARSAYAPLLVGKIARMFSDGGAITMQAATISNMRLLTTLFDGAQPCSASFKQLANAPSLHCSFSTSKGSSHIKQDLGPANPVPEELSESRFTNSITHKLVEAGNRGDLAGVLSVVESAGEEFDESAVEAALLQVERCTQGMASNEIAEKVHKTPTFQMLADMAVSTAGKSAPEVLARTIAVFGRLGFADEMVIDTLARHLMDGGVYRLDPQQMVQLVEGLNKADHSPGVLLLDAINERLRGLGNEVQQQQADTIKEGLRGLGHTGDNVASPEEPQQQPDRINYT